MRAKPLDMVIAAISGRIKDIRSSSALREDLLDPAVATLFRRDMVRRVRDACCAVRWMDGCVCVRLCVCVWRLCDVSVSVCARTATLGAAVCAIWCGME